MDFFSGGNGVYKWVKGKAAKTDHKDRHDSKKMWETICNRLLEGDIVSIATRLEDSTITHNIGYFFVVYLVYSWSDIFIDNNFLFLNIQQIEADNLNATRCFETWRKLEKMTFLNTAIFTLCWFSSRIFDFSFRVL